jgi:hypothetical protein
MRCVHASPTLQPSCSGEIGHIVWLGTTELAVFLYNQQRAGEP